MVREDTREQQWVIQALIANKPTLAITKTTPAITTLVHS
jgi:hypothetical protein